METINGLKAVQVKELLQDLEPGPHIEERGGKKWLRHEYIRARLNEICGPFGWGEQDLIRPNRIYDEVERRGKEEYRVVAYEAWQRLILRRSDGAVQTFYDGYGIWGASFSMGKQMTIWDMYSDVANGARSVALCRAAMSLGESFGLSFYADGLETSKVRFSLPHGVPHEYLAGDTEGTELPEGDPEC